MCRILIYDTVTFELVARKCDTSDCVNAVQFHPYSALLASCNGQRYFNLPKDNVSANECDSDSDSDEERLESKGDLNHNSGDGWSGLQLWAIGTECSNYSDLVT